MLRRRLTLACGNVLNRSVPVVPKGIRGLIVPAGNKGGGGRKLQNASNEASARVVVWSQTRVQTESNGLCEDNNEVAFGEQNLLLMK